MKKKGVIPQIPPNPLPHVVNRFVEIGMREAAGMDVVPLSWREIDAWCACTGVDLDPWEARLIRRLSAEYIAEGKRAESENCPPPWHSGVTAREAAVEMDELRSALG